MKRVKIETSMACANFREPENDIKSGLQNFNVESIKYNYARLKTIIEDWN